MLSESSKKLGEIYTMNVEFKKVISMQKSPDSIGLGYVSYSPLYSNIFFTGENNGEIGLNVLQNDGTLKRQKYPIHSNKVTKIFSSELNENLLISMGLDQTVCLFDLNEGKVVQKIKLDFPILCGDINEADYTLAVGGFGGKLLRLDLRNLSEPSMKFLGHETSDVVDVHFNRREGGFI